MMRIIFCALGVVLWAMSPAVAQDAYPDLRGTWSGPADRVILDAGTGEAVFETQKITLIVKGQQDRRFFGSLDFMLDGKAQTHSVAGIFTGEDRFRWAEVGGFADGRVIDDRTIEACYIGIKEAGHLAACETLTRQ